MKRRKMALIAGGIFLLAAATAAGLLIRRAVRSVETDPDVQEEREPVLFEKQEESKTARDSEESEAARDPEESQSPEEGRKPDEPSEAKASEELRESEDMAGGNTQDSLYYGPLQVVGAKLCDNSGNPVQLRGISTHGLAWFPDYVNEALFQELHEQWNANVIRLAMYTAEYGGYCTGGDRERLKKLIRNGVEYASDQNMYVIVDWHILSDGDPNTYKEEAKSFFGEITAEFADRENVLYEICNEPNGGTSWRRVKEYAEEIIPVIRENDEDAVILVGTPNWSQYVDQAAADPITGWDNIMYTLHFYAATHKESLRRTLTTALDGGLPVFVSEFSICDASGNGAIDAAQAKAWVETMDEYQVSYVAWSLSNKNETSALISSSCSKTSGLSAEDLSDTGKWLYGILGGGRSRDGLQGNPPDGEGGDSKEDSRDSSREDLNQWQESNSKEDQGQTGAEAAGADDLNVTLKLSGSWESNGKNFYQYEMTVENISDRRIDGWSVEVVFQGTPELSDSWNGIFALEGSTLHVSSVDYNGQLESGASAENIGFIVSGDADLPP